ncbi:MAG: DUF2093 domain-containing protein [Alphaproteobacteria bacterium]
MLKRDGGLPDGPAKLEFEQADFSIVWPGRYVLCAVTGDKIPLENLRYWSVERQEAYKDGEIAFGAELKWRNAQS